MLCRLLQDQSEVLHETEELNYQQGGFLAEKGSVVLLYSKITQERSALFWQIETALSRKSEQKYLFFPYIEAKSLRPCQSCSASAAPGAPLPCALGLVHLQHMLQQQRGALRGKYSPGNKYWRETNGISDRLFPFSEGHWSSWAPSRRLQSSWSRTFLHQPPQGFSPVRFGGHATRVPVPIFFSLGGLSWNYIIVLCPFTSSLVSNNKLNNAFESLCYLLNAVGCCVFELTSTLKSLWFVSRVCYLAISCK